MSILGMVFGNINIMEMKEEEQVRFVLSMRLIGRAEKRKDSCAQVSKTKDIQGNRFAFI
jgi:hypothetical protein